MKKLIPLLLSLLCLLPVQAKGPEAVTDLNQALDQAAKEKKMLFVQFGREGCGNCRTLKGYLAAGDVNLPKDSFIYVDLNCDDPKVQEQFTQRFNVKGDMLPFVVITNSDGEQLVCKSGYGTAVDYKELIKEARKKAEPAKK